MRILEKSAWNAMLSAESKETDAAERRRVACLIAKSIMENELSARQRQVMEYYYLQNMTMPEIARRLGVNVSTVSRTHCRACAALKRRLRACGLMK